MHLPDPKPWPTSGDLADPPRRVADERIAVHVHGRSYPDLVIPGGQNAASKRPSVGTMDVDATPLTAASGVKL